MKFFYGPVFSRRLGKSLGVNVVPYKTCTYSCIYCQLGETTSKTVERKSYFDRNDFLKELGEISELNFDFVTFAGEGEPTLNKDIGFFIRSIKDLGFKVAVLTNGSLLWREDVRQDLADADVVIPSLDAATQKMFEKINRPHVSLKVERVIQGFVEFRRECGRFCIEIMLVKGYNTRRDELVKIKNAIDTIKPDEVYLMVPTRPTTLKVEKPSLADVLEAETIIGSATKIVSPEVGEFDLADKKDIESSLLDVIKRHPLREDQLVKIASKYGVNLSRIKEKIQIVYYDGVKYYTAIRS